jgi:hypothetical protein
MLKYLHSYVQSKLKMLNISVYFHETYKTEIIKVLELLFSEKSRPNHCGIMHLQNNPKITLAHAYDVMSSNICNYTIILSHSTGKFATYQPY